MGGADVDKEILLYQRRAELADAVLSSLQDIEADPDLKRIAALSQAAADAIRIETLVGIINHLIGRDADGDFHLAVMVDVLPEPEPHDVAVSFCRYVKPNRKAEVATHV